MATEKEIDEIKERVHIYDIASSYLTLKRSGSNYFGLCPFHNEKSPSFSVNDDLGIFKCFGCGESGDVISFVQKIESISFKDAVEKLADIAGVHLSHEFKQEKSEKKRIIEMNTLAQQAFTYLLLQHPVGEICRTYIKSRNISHASIKEFGLGYDHGNTIVQLLKKRGFHDSEIIKYGFGVIRQGVLTDKYRGRLIFPIFSQIGDVIGFSGRIIEKNDKTPKYLNSPETEAFKKSSVLYGLYNAKKFIKDADNAILLEGPIDVISAFQHGIKQVCAAQGTSLTTGHLQALKRLTENVSFCFDQDFAGQKALRRSFAIAVEVGMNVRVIKINNAKDVDERVNTNKKGFMDDMAHPLDFLEYVMNSDIKEFNTSTLEGKLKVINDILPLLTFIKDDIKKSFYVTKLAEAVQVQESEIRKMMNTRNEAYKKEVIKNIEKNIRNENARLDYLIALFLQYYKGLQKVIPQFDEAYIYDPNIRALFLKLKAHAQESSDIRSFINKLPDQEKEYCINLMTISLKRLKTNDLEDIQKEINFIADMLKKKMILRDINELKNQLWVYEHEHDEEKVSQTTAMIAELTQKMHDINPV